MEQPELLTVREAAEMAGYSRQTVYTWIDQGKIQAHRFGKLRLLDRAAFVSFIATYTPQIGRPRKMGTNSPEDGNVKV